MATATRKRSTRRKKPTAKKQAGRQGSTAAAAGDAAKQFDYDAVEDKKRRQAPRIRLLREDDHLTPSKRRKLTATSRDLARNYSLAAWAVRCHVAYIASFAFKAQTGNDSLDQQLTELVSKWSNRSRFDYRQKHGLNRFLRIAEIRRVLDGDVFWHKMRDGSVSAIEEDRIRTPTRATTLSASMNLDDVTHGVWETPGGRARGYCLHNRTKGGGFEFDRVLQARHVLPHGYYDRYDQTRGVSPMAPAINALRDTYESLTYAAIKAKIGQLFGYAIKWSPDREDSPGDVTSETDDDGNVDKSETEVDFGAAPFVLDLLPDESVDTLETAQPSTEFQTFMKLLVMVSLRAINIPYCFWDESSTNYSGQRNAWLVYDRLADSSRDDNRDLLNSWLAWRTAIGVLTGELVLPKSMLASDLRWLWISRGIPWVDILKEVKADKEAVGAGFQSTNRVCLTRHGVDAYTIADEEAALQEYRRKKGLAEPVTSLPAWPSRSNSILLP